MISREGGSRLSMSGIYSVHFTIYGNLRTYTIEQMTTDLTDLLTSRPWLIVSLQPKEIDGVDSINRIGDDKVLPLDTFFLSDCKSVIRHALDSHDDAAFIPMKRWGVV